MQAVEIKNLTKHYGKSRGVEDISLGVEEGDIFGFLGPNGAGKSTTIRCLLGMLHFQAGEASILGYEVGSRQREILRRTGYMPSEVMFYPSMKVSQVIRLAARLRGLDCTAEAKRLCDRLEVDTGKRIAELSLGNRKKVSIVCAMQHKPGLLVLDEPTSGLDPLMQEAFFDLLLESNRAGTTCFLSSHVLPEVKKYCRHAGIIREGRLVRVDSVENLTKSNLRKVKLTGVDTLPALPGITGVQAGKGEVTFSYTGDSKVLLALLQKLEPADVLIEEPSLEEIFMHFYEEGREENGNGTILA